MSNGFIQIPRSLIQDPIWESFSLEYRSIYLTIVFNAAYSRIELDDFGVKTIINPGQLLMTERELISKAFPPTKDPKKLQKYKSCVHRALKKFEKVGFSNHKTNHKKTIHTITRIDILERYEPIIEPIANQTRTKLEPQKKKENKEKKEKNSNNSEKILPISANEQEIPQAINQDFHTNATSQDNITYIIKTQPTDSHKDTSKGSKKNLKFKSDQTEQKSIPRVKRRPNIETSEEEHFDLLEYIKSKKFTDLGKELELLELAYDNMSQWKNEQPKEKQESHTDFGRLKRWGITAAKRELIETQELIAREKKLNSYSNVVVNKQSNIDYAKEIYAKYKGKIRDYVINLGHNYIEFSPNGGNAQPLHLKIEEKGLKEQIESFLRKCGAI